MTGLSNQKGLAKGADVKMQGSRHPAGLTHCVECSAHAKLMRQSPAPAVCWMVAGFQGMVCEDNTNMGKAGVKMQQDRPQGQALACSGAECWYSKDTVRARAFEPHRESLGLCATIHSCVCNTLCKMSKVWPFMHSIIAVGPTPCASLCNNP